MRDVRAGAVQFNHRPGDKQYNLERITALTAEAAAQGVEILAFPEMCITGYWHVRLLGRDEIDALAEPVPNGPSTEALLRLATEHDLVLGAGLIERADDGSLYNSYVVAQPDGSHFCHRKLHTFISEHMKSGDQYTVFDSVKGCRIGVLTCYDNNIVENVRATALMGAEVLLSPHQTGGCLSRSPHAMGRIDPALWENREQDPAAIEAEFQGPKGRGWLMRWLPARAHDNGLFVVFSNGVGIDDDEVRTGNAMILDPYGRTLAETWRAGDALVVADLEAELLPHSTGRRWLRGRRPELYGKLVETTGREVDPRVARFTAE